jgi:hypothetical protein
LELIVIYLQQFNLVPIFNLVIKLDSECCPTPATITIDDHGEIVFIGELFEILHMTPSYLEARERISKLKFQLVTEWPNKFPSVPTILVTRQEIRHTGQFVLTKLDDTTLLIHLL